MSYATLRERYRAHHGAHRATDWRAAAWAGLIAGAIFMMAEMLMAMLFEGKSPWAPPHMIAAMVFGQDVMQGPMGFDMKIMATAMMIHFPLSVVYALILGWLVHRMDAGIALLVGAVFGLVIYLVDFYPVADAVFPWFAMARGWVSAAAHMLFGLAASGAYVGIRRQ